MAMNSVLLVLIALSFSCLALAADPAVLQDFCIAKATSSVNVNGLTCKDASRVHVNDFLFKGLHIPGNTSNAFGFKVTPVFVTQLRGLNTFGITMARFDFAQEGINSPHVHPRATEILTVLQGTIEVGFVTSSPDNKLFIKVLQKGDVFVFPIGLVHFQRNVGYGNAVAIVALSSQNPGVISVGNALFGSNIEDSVLAKALQVDKSTVDQLQSKFQS